MLNETRQLAQQNVYVCKNNNQRSNNNHRVHFKVQVSLETAESHK
jgi:hypothetical protein